MVTPPDVPQTDDEPDVPPRRQLPGLLSRFGRSRTFGTSVGLRLRCRRCGALIAMTDDIRRFVLRHGPLACRSCGHHVGKRWA